MWRLVFLYILAFLSVGHARTHVKLADVAVAAEETTVDTSATTTAVQTEAPATENTENPVTEPATEGYTTTEAFELGGEGAVCDKSCSALTQCLVNAEDTCNAQCSQHLGECADVYAACDAYTSEQGWYTDAGTAYQTCDDYSGYELTCYDDDDYYYDDDDRLKKFRFRRSADKQQKKGQPKPPKFEPNKNNQNNGNLPPMKGQKPDCKNLDMSCWDKCFKSHELPCFHGCPRPTQEQIVLIKQCENTTYGPVDAAFDQCLEEYDEFREDPGDYTPGIPQEFNHEDGMITGQNHHQPGGEDAMHGEMGGQGSEGSGQEGSGHGYEGSWQGQGHEGSGQGQGQGHAHGMGGQGSGGSGRGSKGKGSGQGRGMSGKGRK